MQTLLQFLNTIKYIVILPVASYMLWKYLQKRTVNNLQEQQPDDNFEEKYKDLLQ